MASSVARRARWLLLAAVLCSFWQVTVVLLSYSDPRGGELTWREVRVWCQWALLTSLGPRRVVALLQLLLPQYSETLFFYPVSAHPGVAGLVALTIDDGICRQEPSRSLLRDVLSLLKNQSAHATFFLNSDYLHEGDLSRLVHAGHEVANHLPSDRSYAEDEFRSELLRTDAVLAPYISGPRWFRAPQGRLTKPMAAVLQGLNITHVLGDAYAEDWAISDPALAASLYLRQAAAGSVLILHMPERGFREHILETLHLVLRGLQAKGLRAVTLGHLAAVAGQRQHGRLRGTE